MIKYEIFLPKKVRERGKKTVNQLTKKEQVCYIFNYEKGR